MLRCIEDLIEARVDKAAAADQYAALQQLELERNYPARIQKLEDDLEKLLYSIQNKTSDLDNLSSGYYQNMEMAEAELSKLKEAFRGLLEQFTEYANTKYGITNEVAIYSKLLDFEHERLQAVTQKVDIIIFNERWLRIQ